MIVLVGYLFHGSALVGILLYFVPRKRLSHWAQVAVLVLSFLALTYVGEVLTWLTASGDDRWLGSYAVEKVHPLRVALAFVPIVIEGGVISQADAENLCLIVGVFIHWQAADDKKIFDYNYQATKESIARALKGEPKVADVLKQYNLAYTEKELRECVSFDKA